ncbi:glycosyltransferase family 2 protein [soil metagenome]
MYSRPDSAPVLAVVVPCFNEEDVLPETMRRLDAILENMMLAGQIDPSSKAWYVDDGSRDRTWNIIHREAMAPGSRIAGIKLSRNRGHQIALLAGLMQAEGDVLISVDADLQDDLAAIPLMLEAHAAGSDIVFGVRSTRERDTAFKRLTAEGYYRLLRRMGVEIVFNHADYRLMSRRAVESLRGYEESNIFLRGMIPLLGYPTSQVEYQRAERFAGESKYPLGKMLALAWQGVTSFSAVPLRAITTLGVIVSLISLSMGVWALGVRLFTNEALPGWASIVIPQFLLSGVQLLSLGVIGEYLAKIFIETKRRPPYFVESLVGSSPAASDALAGSLPARRFADAKRVG